ncbi:MAG: protein kinase [Polyangiaceae bacterium]|nr:protein kinase [Polyangiaceae bacterium]
MNRPPVVDPHAATHADDQTPGLWTTPSAKLPHVDPRADTIPSDGAASQVTPTPAPFENDPLLGSMLGHFRVDALIGRGGMGAVYRAWDTSLLRPVALKVLLSDSVTARTRFLREARSQAQLRHPNVVPIHYVGESEGIVFLVMDLVEGESLNDLIRRDGRVAPDRALDIVDAVASALAAGHAAGLIHRDVKPSNILLERSGRALLADFGLAKDIAALEIVEAQGAPNAAGASVDAPVSIRSAALTRAGSIVGTPAYLAPEQAAGGVVDHRADMYALGASLFEALTGAPPFDAPTPTAIVELQRTQMVRSPRALVADLHPTLEQLVLRMLHKEPVGRFATYDELRAAISRARTPMLLTAPPVPRLVAFAIDYALFSVFAGIVGGGLFAAGLPGGWIAWVLAVAGASVLEWRLGGQGLGKRLMQMRTADRYGLTPSFWIIAARTFYKALGPAMVWFELNFLPAPLAPVAAVFTVLLWVTSFVPALGKSRLALHDRLTRTRVIFAESPHPRS